MSEQNIEWTKLAEEKSFENNSEQLHKVKRDDILIVKMMMDSMQSTIVVLTWVWL